MQHILRNSRALTLAVLMAIAAAFAVVSTTYAAPASQADNAQRGYFGVVTEVGTDRFTIETQQGAEEILFTAETRFMSGPDEADASLLRIDQRVAVRARLLSDGSAEALQVMIIPAEPRHTHRTVTVVERTSAGTVVRDREGNELILEGDLDLDGEGDVVTVVVERRPAGQGEGANARLRAQAAVKADVVIERLQERVREDTGRDPEKLAELEARLRLNMERHIEQLSTTASRLPEQARERVEEALRRQVDNFEERLRDVGRNVEVDLAVQAAGGVLQDVNLNDLYIVVETESAGTMRFRFDANTRVQIDGNDASVRELEAGDLVRLRYDVRTHTALHISASTGDATAAGTILAVDADAGVVAVSLRGLDLRLRVTDATQITVNGVQARIGDLREGMEVRVMYDSRSQEAKVIAAHATATAIGLLASVDSTTGQIVLEVDGGRLVLQVTGQSDVELNGIAVRLARLEAAVGQGVAVVYDTRTMEVLKLSVRLDLNDTRVPEVVRDGIGGEIVRVGRGTIVVMDGRNTVELGVNVDTSIVVGDRRGGIDELKEGMTARVVYDRATMTALSIHVAQQGDVRDIRKAEVDGRIVSFDRASSTLALALENGRTLELRLGNASSIESALGRGSIADLVAGVRVHVVYEEPSMVVLAVRLDIEVDRVLTDALRGR